MDIKLLDLPTKEIYIDLFQPGMKKVGEALSTVLDSANLILLPLKLINERSKVYFQDNIKKYSEKLNNKELTPSQVPPYVGLPIIDKLTYLEQNELSEAFLNLLTKASFDETLNLAHPTFVTILNNLSNDEAKILFFYKDHERIPFIDLYIHKFKETVSAPEQNEQVINRDKLKQLIDYTFQEREHTFLKYALNLTSIERDVVLHYPKNIDLYIENLLHNGLIYFEREIINREDIQRYEILSKKTYKDIHDKLIKDLHEIGETSEYKLEIDIRKCSIQFTELGKGFLNACIKE